MSVTESVKSLSMLPIGNEAIVQRRFVVMHSGGAGLIGPSGAGGDVIGVALVASPDSDTAGVTVEEATAAIPIGTLDSSKLEVEAGAAIDMSAAVVALMSDATGRAVTATATNPILGYALTSASAAGEIITFFAAKAARLQV